MSAVGRVLEPAEAARIARRAAEKARAAERRSARGNEHDPSTTLAAALAEAWHLLIAGADDYRLVRPLQVAMLVDGAEDWEVGLAATDPGDHRGWVLECADRHHLQLRPALCAGVLCGRYLADGAWCHACHELTLRGLSATEDPAMDAAYRLRRLQGHLGTDEPNSPDGFRALLARARAVARDGGDRRTCELVTLVARAMLA